MTETNEEPKVLSMKEKMEKLKEAKLAEVEARKKALVELEKEAEVFSSFEMDEDIETLVETYEDTVAAQAEEFETINKELEPINEMIKEVEEAHKETLEQLEQLRVETLAAITEKVGSEVAVKALLGKGTGTKRTGGTGTRSGKLDGMSVRETVAKMYLDEGITDFEELARTMKSRYPEAKVYGNGEKINGGTQKDGNLMKRHMDEMVTKAGTVVKVDGVYSWK